MAAASVNPIDVRRSEGYGRRLLSLIGAGKFPLMLGNDLAGTVTAVGSRVSTFKVGDRVYGAEARLRRRDPRQPCAGQGCPRAGRSGRP